MVFSQTLLLMDVVILVCKLKEKYRVIILYIFFCILLKSLENIQVLNFQVAATEAPFETTTKEESPIDPPATTEGM